MVCTIVLNIMKKIHYVILPFISCHYNDLFMKKTLKIKYKVIEANDKCGFFLIKLLAVHPFLFFLSDCVKNI